MPRNGQLIFFGDEASELAGRAPARDVLDEAITRWIEIRAARARNEHHERCFELRNRQIDRVKFRRQVPLGKYVVDFLAADHRLVVEIDGGQHASQQAYDRRRTAWLEAQGVPEHEATRYVASMYTDAAEALRAGRPFEELARDHATEGGLNEQRL